MSRISAKRQITLPVALCDELGIGPGDEVESFVANGQITIVKKEMGAAAGILKQVQGDSSVSDEESRQDALRSC